MNYYVTVQSEPFKMLKWQHFSTKVDRFLKEYKLKLWSIGCLFFSIKNYIYLPIFNTYYEYTGNQYTLRDNDHLNEFCPLYPSSLQGKINVDDIQLNVYVIGNTEEIIMSEHATWSDNLNVQIGMMIDWNGLFDL
jgi:hypothetical protein